MITDASTIVGGAGLSPLAAGRSSGAGTVIMPIRDENEPVSRLCEVCSVVAGNAQPYSLWERAVATVAWIPV